MKFLNMIKNLLMIAILGLIAIQLKNNVEDEPDHIYWYRTSGLPKFGSMVSINSVKSPFLHLKDDKGNPSCTAFVVDPNYAVTAAHCVQDQGGKYLTATDENDENPIKIKVVGYYSRGDTAVLLGSFRAFMHLPIVPNEAIGAAIKNRPLLSCGFPLGQKKLVCNAVVVISPMDSKLLGHGEMYPGMSGGPVIDAQTGVVVALNTATMGGEYPERMPDALLFSPLTGLLGVFGME